MAAFTRVSLLSGTTTVWLGVALSALAVVLAVVLKCGRGVLILSIVLLAIAVGSGIYDEVQLQHKRDEISNLFN